MTHGIDTDFLVAAEIRDHPFHPQADSLLRSLLADGHDFAIAPQTLAEFIHIVTFHRVGIKRIVSNNESDYKMLGVFEIVPFKG